MIVTNILSSLSNLLLSNKLLKELISKVATWLLPVLVTVGVPVKATSVVVVFEDLSNTCMVPSTNRISSAPKVRPSVVYLTSIYILSDVKLFIVASVTTLILSPTKYLSFSNSGIVAKSTLAVIVLSV